MQLYKRGRTWWVDYLGLDGQRRRESTRCTDRKAAEAEGARRERDARDPDSAAIRDETVERSLLRLIARTTNAATKRFYTQKSGHLVALLGGSTPIASLRVDHLDGYLRMRRVAVPAPSEHTIHKEVRTLSTALRLSKRCGLFRGDLLALIPPTSAEYTPRDRWLPLHEVVALIAAYHQDYADHAARVAFAVATGAEWSALDRAQREDLGPELVRVRGTKNAKRDRVVPIVTPWQRDLLAFARSNARGREGTLFAPWLQRSALRSLEVASVRAGIAHATWHDLRRTCAQLLRRGGVSFDSLAPVLGHSSTHVTQSVYARLDPHALADRLRAELGSGAVSPVCQTPSDSSDSLDWLDSVDQRKSREVVGDDGLEPSANGLRVRGLILGLRGKRPKRRARKRATVTPVCRDSAIRRRA